MRQMLCSDIPPVLECDWTVDRRIHAFTTLRAGGISEAPYGLDGGAPGGLNLGLGSGDDRACVLENRRRLRARLPGPVHWLHQVHGTGVIQVRGDSSLASPEADAAPAPEADAAPAPEADAAVTAQPNQVLAILTADCIPVFLADADAARAVGIAHAGWRGLAAGVLEASLSALRELAPEVRQWVAHLGPAIGPQAFEVGQDVWQAFAADDPEAAACFVPTGRPGKWLADLPSLARHRLHRAGVGRVTGGAHCTYRERRNFYSYRRDGPTGRMVSMIWLEG